MIYILILDFGLEWDFFGKKFWYHEKQDEMGYLMVVVLKEMNFVDDE